jgi:ornithine carbamoyltransferase
MKHLINLKDWTTEEILAVLELAGRIKARPQDVARAMEGRTLLMLFEKPSLRTRLSFETGTYQMGGHAIYYDLGKSPLGSGKESLHDTIKVISRYQDLVMARLYEHEKLEEMVEHATIPVINALTNYSHPCQALADFLTIQEHKGRLAGLKLAYLGDGNNNVTHSLLFGCARLGMHMAVGCPAEADLRTGHAVLEEARELAGPDTLITMTSDPLEAARGADVVYTDSWMSYHIAPEEQAARAARLRPFQVNDALMRQARPDAIFMNCLPAQRGYEQTAEVIDGPQSVVFDEAENRLHAQKAVMLTLLQSAGRGRAPAL